MKVVQCSTCASRELTEKGGYLVCEYCQTQFSPEEDERPQKPSSIGVGSDIEALLEKCRQDPLNSSRYARLILDLDPTNEEAFGYL